MSRIGNKPVKIPDGAKVTAADATIEVTGPKGSLQLWVNPLIKFQVSTDEVIFSRSSDIKRDKSLHGLYAVLLKNMLSGVTVGFSKKLELVGIGFRAEMKAGKLVVTVGYSHPIIFEPPDGIEIKMEGDNTVVVSGIDKQLVGEIAAKIRSFRLPEPYKGKGIKYEKEIIRRKAGKAAATK